jgi:hypothetical protein
MPATSRRPGAPGEIEPRVVRPPPNWDEQPTQPKPDGKTMAVTVPSYQKPSAVQDTGIARESALILTTSLLSSAIHGMRESDSR